MRIRRKSRVWPGQVLLAAAILVLLAAGRGYIQAATEEPPASKESETPDPAKDGRLDFEVRFIAQPQDRRLIPVTYLPTPASEDEVYPVLHEILMTGKHLAGIDYEDLGAEGYRLALRLTGEGGDRMRRETEFNIGDQLALILRGKILMYPYVREAVTSVIEVQGKTGALKANAKSLYDWYQDLERQ